MNNGVCILQVIALPLWIFTFVTIYLWHFSYPLVAPGKEIGTRHCSHTYDGQTKAFVPLPLTCQKFSTLQFLMLAPFFLKHYVFYSQFFLQWRLWFIGSLIFSTCYNQGTSPQAFCSIKFLQAYWIPYLHGRYQLMLFWSFSNFYISFFRVSILELFVVTIPRPPSVGY